MTEQLQNYSTIIIGVSCVAIGYWLGHRIARKDNVDRECTAYRIGFKHGTTFPGGDGD